MNGTKPWWQSTGMWGGIVATLTPIIGALGYAISEQEQQQIVVGITTVITVISGVVATRGRKVARKEIK
ncbi:MAG: hypothetical protein B7733_13000 [Myxococcales bacterium FL481]|nr:MAG: hypothetical protein B7733_13000 [Myxococcales bacterium FL481]